MENIIEVNHVSMRFRMANDRISSVKEYIVQLIKGKVKYREFEALNDISFSVRKGEIVGIIGHNGAGKSTLLKIISRIMKPTEGSVTVRRNVVPMLELGSGFDLDMTGRENIFLNGAILGYSEEFLNARYDNIVAFSELEPFIDVPIRNYSSGMVARLAFAIASEVSPEILIVDEILGVGDADFQRKSYARMMEMMGGGTTVLMVSHSIEDIEKMCDRVVWIEHGQVQAIGEATEICSRYKMRQG